MTINLDYLYALAETRSCLAALADGADDIDESSYFERLLIAVDGLHPDGPATYSMDGSSDELFRRLETAVDRMIALGGDALSLELLLTAARGRD